MRPKMANPEVCPWCGAAFDHEGVLWGFYECDSSIGSNPNESDYGNLEQSHKCKDRQIAQLKAQVEKLEDFVKVVESGFDGFEKKVLDALFTLEKNNDTP